MRKFLLAFFLLPAFTLNAQIEVVKMLGKNSSDYGIGLGAALKFSIPVSEAAYVSIEGSVVFASIKQTSFSEGIALVPIKVGYRYTVNGSGTGFYVEPQAGYCVYGALTNEFVDEKVKGFDWAIGIGYLFDPWKKLQFDVGLRYETVYFKDGPASFIALRISHNFTLGKRNAD